MGVFDRIGADPEDTSEIQLKKRSLVALAFLVGVAGLAWGAIYLAVDETLAASIPGGYVVVSGISIGIFAATGRYQLFRTTQLALILVLPFMLMVTLGGFINASAVILWSFMAPLGALLVSGRREAVYWFVAFTGLLVVSRFLQPYVRADNNLSDAMIILFFVLNIVGVSLVVFLLLQYFVGQRDLAMRLLGREQQKSERLLLNVLPSKIAQALKEEERTIADHHPEVSVLFADIVGFTPLSDELDPIEMVDLLNEVFTYFDGLCQSYQVEKIRTIGDAYMVAAGVPTPRLDHAAVLARVALDMNAFHDSGASDLARRLKFRFGLNSGPVVAGVIGDTKFQYDIWGDTVNTASRMESHGVPGRIQITKSTYELIREDFACVPRGPVQVKGKGTLYTWFLEGIR